MEHAIGTRITLEVVEDEKYTCIGCFFYNQRNVCNELGVKCLDEERTDHKNIIYKEIKED